MPVLTVRFGQELGSRDVIHRTRTPCPEQRSYLTGSPGAESSSSHPRKQTDPPRSNPTPGPGTRRPQGRPQAPRHARRPLRRLVRWPRGSRSKPQTEPVAVRGGQPPGGGWARLRYPHSQRHRLAACRQTVLPAPAVTQGSLDGPTSDPSIRAPAAAVSVQPHRKQSA